MTRQQLVGAVLTKAAEFSYARMQKRAERRSRIMKAAQLSRDAESAAYDANTYASQVGSKAFDTLDPNDKDALRLITSDSGLPGINRKPITVSGLQEMRRRVLSPSPETQALVGTMTPQGREYYTAGTNAFDVATQPYANIPGSTNAVPSSALGGMFRNGLHRLGSNILRSSIGTPVKDVR